MMNVRISGTLLALALFCASCLSDCGSDFSCKTGTEACGDDCVDLLTDELNCGRCGTICNHHLHCLDGECSCFEGYTDCGTDCVILDSDEDHCGACGFECPPNEECREGHCCPVGADCESMNLTTCEMPGDTCGGSCFDTDTDENHCGECHNACQEEEACVDGICAVPPCEDFWDCEEDKVCFDSECVPAYGLNYRIVVMQILVDTNCEGMDEDGTCPDLQVCFFRDVEGFTDEVDSAEFCTSVQYDTHTARWEDEYFDTVLLETDDWTIVVLDENLEGWTVLREFRFQPIDLFILHQGFIMGPEPFPK